MLVKKAFYFIRHGQTDHNRKHIYAGGKTDVPLNKTGKRQAKALRKRLHPLPINQVVCSPMKRALQTARLATQRPLIIDQGMKECDLGDFEGMPVPDFIRYADATPAHIPFPNGESRTDIAKRAINSINNCLASHGENLLFISHGMVYWSLLEALHIPFHHIPNAQLVHFKPHKNSWVLWHI